MKYAPVIIPTLCRFEHFKKCIDSLNENHNADKTEVYISVDAPTKEEHREGHDLICDYLDNTTFRFKEIYVYKQKENLGIDYKKKLTNSRFLRQIVQEKYDRWIFSEDDNLFSPNFLDFINEGLDKYENNKDILAIGGYRFFYNLKFNDNNFFRQQMDFNAWGYGIWKDRWEKIMSNDYTYLKKMVFSPVISFKIWRKSNLRMSQLIFFSYKQYFKKGDNYFSLYMIHENMYQIMPAVSKVRNLGWDNSGLHCNNFSSSIMEAHQKQSIDDKESFDGYIGSGWEYYQENEDAIVKEDFQHSSFLKVLVKYLIRIAFFWK